MRQPSQSRPGQGYHLGIDLGSTCTAAAVCRAAGSGRPEPVPLGESTTAIATLAVLTDDGELLVGEAARRRSATEPQRVARGFTRRIGDGTPLVLGDHTLTADDIAARFVRSVVDLVAAREGGAPDSIALTHPADWGPHRRLTLTRALAAAGIADVLLVSEPVAAALGHAGPAGLTPGAVHAVYDLGGDSFTAAVLAGSADGTPELRGRPVGRDDLGGIDFDEHVLDHVRDALGEAWYRLDPTDPDVLAAVAALRRDCTTAKEALSADVDAAIPVMLPGAHTRVRIGRADFEDRIRGDVAETVETLLRALAAAGVTPSEPRTVLLVGGSSRIPLVPQLVSAGLGRPISVDTDPRTTVARGAAIAALRQARPAAERPETEPAVAPQRPVVPHLLAATPAWPVPARRPRDLRIRAALVAALATTGIALAAVATAYTLDPALLSGETPVALVGPAATDSAANVQVPAAGTAAEPPEEAEQPDEPVAAAPARAAAAPARHVARTVRTAATPTALPIPAAAPVTAAPVPTAPPTSAAPTTPRPGTAGPGDGAGESPPANGGSGSTPPPPPPAGGDNHNGTGTGNGGSTPTDGNTTDSDPAPGNPPPSAAPVVAGR